MPNEEVARQPRLWRAFVGLGLRRLSGFAIAGGAVLAAVGVRLELYPLLGVHSPYIPFILAVLVAARFGGLLPGLTVTALSAISIVWFFLDEHDLFALGAFFLFILTGTLISLLVGRLRRAFLAMARAEEALRRQSQSIDLSHDAIITMDAERRIIKWNQGAQEMYGWAEREAVGKVMHRFLKTSGGLSTAEIDKVLGREGKWNGELSHMTRDGRHVVVDSRQVLVQRDEHSPAVILEINREITERKRAEDAVCESEERLRALVTASSNLLFRMSPDWSEMRHVRGSGLIADTEAPCRDWLQRYIHQDDQLRVRAAVDEAIRTKSIFELEYRVLRVDGSLGWTFSRAIPVLDQSGRIVEWFGAASDITPRKQAEEALRESEERLRIAQQAARIGTFEWDIRTGVNRWTPELEAMYGLSPGGFAGTQESWEKLVHSDDRATVAQLVKQAFETGAPTEGEWRVVWPDGSVHWVTGRWQVFKDAGGMPLRMTGASFDITERKQAEARLKESESFHRQMLESIPGMVFTTRPDGYCDYQSQQWVEYTGVPMSEHLGDGWNKLLHPDDRPRAFAAWRRAVEGNAPYDLEYRVRRYDGAYDWFKVNGRPIRDANGQIVRWFGVAMNIEELKRAEQSVREALDLSRLAMETAKLGAWDYRLDSVDVVWDEQSSKIFGLTGQNRIEYEQLMTRIHPDDRAPIDAAIKLAIAGADGGTYNREFRVVWPDSSVHWVAGHGRVFFEGEGDERRPVRVVGVNMEVTERRHAEDRLRQTQKLESIGLLAGGVAHDFNNLLTVIMGSASSALEQCPSCEHSQEILSASQRAAYLTKQLLAYAGKGQFVTTQFDLSELVSKSTALVSASVPKRVSVAYNLAQCLPPLEGDPSRVEQILMNLTINAGEAIPPKTDGKIEIATGSCTVTAGIASQHTQAFDVQTGPHVFLEVRDNGSGMDETTVSKIFDPFFSTKFTGRGLGLAAVHGIVRSTKGFIEVHSSPGRGSTFKVFLPVSEKEPSTQASRELPAGVSRQQLRGSATILVVDDEDMVRKLACMTLKGHGYDVLEAKDGKGALQVLADSVSVPEIALIDLAMPVMGGDELVPILEHQYPGLKVVISSGYPEEDARKGFATGAVAGFLQKPYTIVALLEKIREIVPGSGPGTDSRILKFPKTG